MLHGAELWGAFVSLFSLDVPRAFSGWLLGFGSKPRADRLIGCVEVRDLAVQATARAVRTLHDAQRHGGLLALAISQLHYNWESSRTSDTWYGLLLREIHTVWPRFKLTSSSPVQWSGAPPVDSVDTLGRRFSAAVWQSRWLNRQISVLSTRPSISRQDHLLYNILLYSGCNELRQQHQDGRNIDRSLLLSSALFCTKPSVSARSFRRLLRFVAGLEDFARTNAHQPQRRRIFPELGQEDLKRSCLFCFVNLKHTVLDSEWHSFFSCPACEEPRQIFIDTFPRFHNLFYPGYETEEPFSDFIEASPQQSLDQSTLPNYKLQISRLAKIIHEARFNRYLTNELSRFVINIHVCRRRVFRSLSTNRPHSPLDGALRSRHLDALEF